MAFVLQSFAEDTLASDITDSSTSMTLTTGNFGTPSGEQMLVIDPDVSSKREIVKCAIDGTAVTSIDRAQDGTAAVAHTSGAKIIMAWTKSHHEALKDGTDLNDNIITAAKLDANLLAGWLLLAASGTRVSNTSFTVSGDVTDQIAVGDKLKITDTTTKYLYVTAVTYGAPNTTITVTGGTDYVVDGNPTNIYYSKAVSSVGFPNNMIARARAKRSTNQTIGTGSWTKVQLNSKTFDVGSNFDNATNYRFTAPITGYYQVNASTQWVDPAGSDFYTKIYKNGSGIATAASHNITANIITQSLSDVVQLNAAEYVELYVYQGSGGNKSINKETYMSVALLSLT
jgi:hypothetical protein